MPQVLIDRNRCKGCELCVQACPQRVLAMSKAINEKGYFFAEVVRGERCIGCRLCGITCPDLAVTIGLHGCRYSYFDY
jgi:2-oxoglutarate ferredoxin oxidoreductase subunit delta